MRSFVAIELPEDLRQKLVERSEPAQCTLPNARWLPASNLHLTLAFLGELAVAQTAKLAAELADLFAVRQPFELKLEGAGCFPSGARARVAWLGFAPSPELNTLQTAVVGISRQLVGRPPEARPFSAHLTLARARRPWSTQAVASWKQAMAGEHGVFFVGCGSLMESQLRLSGFARHRAVAEFPLEGA